ncbi:MAG: hypothetical protein HC828_11180, partial [Blastochloris sp.]|nr:hypothetical protein [Blastochloris sp.]
GGSASLQMFGGTTGGVGGNGSGTSDGGDGFGGRNFLELVSGTLNVAGDLMLVDEATGGSGANGGDALGGIGGEGGGIVLTVTGSTINLLPGGNSTGRIVIGGSTRGALAAHWVVLPAVPPWRSIFRARPSMAARSSSNRLRLAGRRPTPMALAVTGWAARLPSTLRVPP